MAILAHARVQVTKEAQAILDLISTSLQRLFENEVEEQRASNRVRETDV